MQILQSIGDKIGFEWQLSLTHLINFLIIFFLLVRFALPKIKTTIEDRTKKIATGLKMREDADKILESSKEEKSLILKDANIKRQEILSKSEDDSKKVISEARVKSSEIIQESEKIKSSAKALGLTDAQTEMSAKLPDILASIASGAFKSKVTAEINADFVKNIFNL